MAIALRKTARKNLGGYVRRSSYQISWW